MPLRFRDGRKLARHFSDHGADFGAANAADYEAKADAFLNCPLSADCEERIRARDNAMIRFNTVTDEFGVVSDDGFLLTYYKPDPAIHGEPTNYDYYLNC